MMDYLITNACLIDPESGADFPGSLGIKDGIIDGLYPVSAPLPAAKETLDAEGGILVPGFIDIHAHTENDIPCAERLLAMGTTTALSGNCGSGSADLPGFFAEFEKNGYPLHQLEMTGHTRLREKAGQADVYAPATKSQKETMKDLAREAFSAGAAGLSFGLEYVPGSPPEEVIEMAQTAAEADRFISIHGRLKEPGDLDSLREALDLAVITGTRVIYSHLVYMYQGEKLKEALKIIEVYRKKACILADSGMYTAFATYAGSAVFKESILEHKDFDINKLRAATGKYAGLILDRDKFLEVRRNFPRESLIYQMGEAEDIFNAYSLPGVMVSTDCMKYPAGEGHPQGAATYPYFFRRLVKEQKKLSLPDALRRCTLFPARAAGLETKGRLKPGMDADLVILDWENLREHADFPGSGDPGAAPSGVKHVFVSGVLSIKNEKRIPGAYAGIAIKH
jgi:N-acyl-D-amino-acid deacylase